MVVHETDSVVDIDRVPVDVAALSEPLPPQDSAPAVAGRSRLLKLSENMPTLTSYFVKFTAAAGTLYDAE